MIDLNFEMQQPSNHILCENYYTGGQQDKVKDYLNRKIISALLYYYMLIPGI